MVKLVVADDEERVCRLIVALGNWEELGIKVVGTAANGIQALELIRKEKTDILISKILYFILQSERFITKCFLTGGYGVQYNKLVRRKN